MVKAKSRVSGVVLTGPLASFCDAYRLELSARGYTERSVVPLLRQSNWSGCGGVPGVFVRQAGERVEQGDGVLGGGGGVGADGGEGGCPGSRGT